MEQTLPTTADTEREEKRADELKPGDWLAIPHPVKVLFVYAYLLRSHITVMVVYEDPYFLAPERQDWNPEKNLPLATKDEIPEDAYASGRDITETPADVPPGVDGYAQSESAIRKAHK